MDERRQSTGPNRFEDGYGLNKERVQQMYEKGYSLLITVDNGIKAYEAIDLANELGIDVIVIDHHYFLLKHQLEHYMYHLLKHILFVIVEHYLNLMLMLHL